MVWRILTTHSMATRIAYAVILLVNSILSWIMLTPWALKKLQHLTLDYMTITCDGKQCTGWVAVHRINFALGLFHAILAVLLLGVRSSKDGRAALQNGFWGPKIILWLAFVVMTFFIPESFFMFWGNYIALAGAMLFLLLGLILLVDLAHTWAEYCLEKIENQDSKAWRTLLIGSTLGMYIASFAMIIVMYIFFAYGGCSMNQAAITVRVLGKRDVEDAANDIGQPYCTSHRFLHLNPSHSTRVQSSSWTRSIGYGSYLLHISYNVGGVHGTR